MNRSNNTTFETPKRSSERITRQKKVFSQQTINNDSSQLNNMVACLLDSNEENYSEFKIPRSKCPKNKVKPHYQQKKKPKPQSSNASRDKTAQSILDQLKLHAAQLIEEKWTTFITDNPLLEIVNSQIKMMFNEQLIKSVENKVIEIHSHYTSNDQTATNIQAENIRKLEISLQENLTKINEVKKQNEKLMEEKDNLKFTIEKLENVCENSSSHSACSIMLTGTSINIQEWMGLHHIVHHLNNSLHDHHNLRIPHPVIRSCKPIFKSNSKTSNRVVLQFINQYEKERLLTEINKRSSSYWRGPRPLYHPKRTLFVEEYLNKKQAGFQYELRNLRRICKEKILSVFTLNGISAVQLRSQSNALFIHSEEDLQILREYLTPSNTVSHLSASSSIPDLISS